MLKRVGLFALLIPGVALAGPTGLTIIPIADVLGHREFSFSVGSEGTNFDVSQRGSHSNSLEFGLGDRFELGYDNDFLGDTTFNMKVQFVQTKHGAISAGIMNVKSGQMAPFVVGRFDGKGYRLHAGWLKDGKNRLIAGADFPIYSMTGMIDYVSGPDGVVWFGVNVPMPKVKGLAVGLGAGLATQGKSRLMHTVSVGYDFKM